MVLGHTGAEAIHCMKREEGNVILVIEFSEQILQGPVDPGDHAGVLVHLVGIPRPRGAGQSSACHSHTACTRDPRKAVGMHIQGIERVHEQRERREHQVA